MGRRAVIAACLGRWSLRTMGRARERRWLGVLSGSHMDWRGHSRVEGSSRLLLGQRTWRRCGRQWCWVRPRHRRGRRAGNPRLRRGGALAVARIVYDALCLGWSHDGASDLGVGERCAVRGSCVRALEMGRRRRRSSRRRHRGLRTRQRKKGRSWMARGRGERRGGRRGMRRGTG